MMILTVTAVFLVAIFSAVPTSGDDDGDCKEPAAVHKFSAAFFAAMIVSTDKNVTLHLKIGGGKGGSIVHDEVKRVLEDHKQCNAEEVAFVAGRALSIDKVVTLPNYFKKSADTMAKALLEFGILNCDNAIELALKFYSYVHHRMEGRDKTIFATFAHGIVYGWLDFYLYLGLKLSDVSQESANLFYQSFSVDKPTCPFANDSSDGAAHA